MPTTTTGVALLRGINVGGKNKLPMTDLAAIFSAAGCTAVRTYIQSGNVIFTASPALIRRLPSLVSTAIKKQFGLTVPVITRDAGDLQQLIASNPYLAKRSRSCPWCLRGESQCLHVGFLADTPDPARAKALDPDRSPGDSFHLRGREVFLHLPNGVARTKITNAWLDAALETVSTFRNWRTVLKLAEMTAAG